MDSAFNHEFNYRSNIDMSNQIRALYIINNSLSYICFIIILKYHYYLSNALNLRLHIKFSIFDGLNLTL